MSAIGGELAGGGISVGFRRTSEIDTNPWKRRILSHRSKTLALRREVRIVRLVPNSPIIPEFSRFPMSTGLTVLIHDLGFWRERSLDCRRPNETSEFPAAPGHLAQLCLIRRADRPPQVEVGLSCPSGDRLGHRKIKGRTPTAEKEMSDMCQALREKNGSLSEEGGWSDSRRVRRDAGPDHRGVHRRHHDARSERQQDFWQRLCKQPAAETDFLGIRELNFAVHERTTGRVTSRTRDHP